MRRSYRGDAVDQVHWREIFEEFCQTNSGTLLPSTAARHHPFEATQNVDSMALQLPDDDHMSLGFTEETSKLPNVAAMNSAQVLVATLLTLYEVAFEIHESCGGEGSL